MAVILATIVLVGFQLLYPQPNNRPSVPAPLAKEQPAATTQLTAPTDVAAGQDGFDRSGASAAPVTVRRNDYEAVLSPTGGILREWRLRRYSDAKEQQADLVTSSAQGLFRLAVVAENRRIDLSDINYQVRGGTSDPAAATILTAEGASGQHVELRWVFPDDSYAAELSVRLDGFDNSKGDLSLELAFPQGLPVLERTPQQDRLAFASAAMVGKQVIRHHQGHAGVAGCGGSSRPFESSEPGVVHWIGAESKYFLAAAMPEQTLDATAVFRRMENEGPIKVAVRVPLALDGPTERHFTIYAGPLEFQRLKSYGVGLENAVQLGYRIFRPLTQLLLQFFQGVYRFVPNYGLVIVVLSVLLKLLFYPLTRKSMESMSQMQRLKPEIDRLSEKFKDDPQRRNQAMFELYRKHKINPMGGCLPLLLQMPVFIGLYNVFGSAIELRKAPFFLWITDLSAPDRVGAILGQPIHILPLLMAGTSLLQAKLTPSAPNQASMTYLMPLVTTMIFYGLPSGLVLYWTVTNVIQIGQQILMNRSAAKTAISAGI